MDLTAVQVKRHHLWDARETFARKIMEMVSTHIKQKSVARETIGHFSVAAVLTCSMLNCSLDGESKGNKTCGETEKCIRFKGIVPPKMKILSSFTHPQVVPNLYEFICSAEHKGRYFEESL